MATDDSLGDISNPDRRNLNLLSLSIITYHIAGGQLTNDVITLQFVDIKFTNPNALVTILWCLFIWYWHRFNISLDQQIFKHFSSAIIKYFNNKGDLLLKELKPEYNGKETANLKKPLKIAHPDPKKRSWRIPCEFGIIGESSIKREDIHLKYFSRSSGRFFLYCIKSNEAFGNIMLPHILALTAIFVTIYSVIF